MTQDKDTPKTIKGRNGGTLKPFKKGQSGNPKGRPKGLTTFKVSLQKILDAEIEVDGLMTNGRDALCSILFKKAIGEGDMKAISEIMDRTDGKPLQATLNVDANERVADEELLAGYGLTVRK
jgi:hypothetical protein